MMSDKNSVGQMWGKMKKEKSQTIDL